MKESVERNLSGWGKSKRFRSRVLVPESISDLADIPVLREEELIARGAGLSYGDAAVCDHSCIVNTKALSKVSWEDREKRLVRCEAGATIAELLDFTRENRCTLPVVPGTAAVTAGGALAADVHGKNHMSHGTFSRWVRSFTLIDAAGQSINVDNQSQRELFDATAGGMGLTGIIAAMTLELIEQESNLFQVRHIPCLGMEELMDVLRNEDPGSYSVAWVDALAQGKHAGRGIVISGKPHIRRPGDISGTWESGNRRPTQNGIFVPFDLPGLTLNRLTVGSFNRLYYHLRSREKETLLDAERFFFPLDAVGNWNRMYGRKGFIQYQFAVPEETAPAAFEETLATVALHGVPVYLCTLKNLGPGRGMLSFPIKGYTLALDMPFSRETVALAAALDALVIKHRGRVYLAKDALLSAEAFRKMYPEYETWRKVKSEIDPGSRFQSALSRRLRIPDVLVR